MNEKIAIIEINIYSTLILQKYWNIVHFCLYTEGIWVLYQKMTMRQQIRISATNIAVIEINIY